MHLRLDADLCQAYGNCLLAAPELFELTETMTVVRILDEHPDESIRAQVEEAVLSCPMQALTLHDQ
jgi:ferredoxin